MNSKKSLKKILMVNDHIHFGGGGDAAFQLERKIFEEVGHEVYTFSQSVAELNNIGKNDYVFLESDSIYKRKFGKFISCRSVGNSLRKILKEIRPNLIKLHLLSKYPADIYRVLGDYPVVQMLHGPNLFCATSWGALKKDGSECEQGIGFKCSSRGCVSPLELPLHMNLSRRVNSSSKAVVNCFFSPSQQLAKTAAELGFTPVEYFPLSVDPSFERVTPTYPDNGTILFIGALVEQKGINFLIDSMLYIKNKYPRVILKIAGKGKLEKEIKRRINDFGLESNVELLGFQNRKSILQLYMNASVVVVPSIWKEQFGLVGLEALACGVPCVGSNIGGIPEWLHHNKSGFLIEPRNSKNLAEAILTLLNNKKMRIQFGEYGRNFVLSNFSYDQYKRNVLRQIDRFSS